MRILNITAQKPHSTGSGIYLTELVKNWNALGYEQAVLAGVYEEDSVNFPEGVIFYPVKYLSEELPFPIAGMSDEMPYKSTRYKDFTEEMFQAYRSAFQMVVRKAVEEFCPDLIVCHHLYLLTALVREWYPKKKVIGICHGSDLRQICKNPLQMEYIQKWIPQLDGIVALHDGQKKEIIRIFTCGEKLVHTVGVGYNQNLFYRKKTEEKPYRQLAFAGKVTEKKGIFSLLRALEMLNKESIMFSTVNPNNRYIHMKNVKDTNNVRSMYIRSITLGGQDEIIYDETDSLKIARAFRKAGRSLCNE